MPIKTNALVNKNPVIASDLINAIVERVNKKNKEDKTEMLN